MSRTPNTPGIDLSLIDGLAGILNYTPTTESVLVIGPATDGPVDQIVKLGGTGLKPEVVYGPMQYTAQYTGPASETTGWNGNFLIKGYKEVQKGGCQNIWLLRVGGTVATGTFTNGAPSSGLTGTITIASPYGGRIYNQTTVAFTSGSTSGYVTIGQPAAKGGNVVIQYKEASSGLTVLQLINQMNSDPRNRTAKFTAGTIATTGLARDLQGAATVTLAGGTDGTDMDDLSSNRIPLYTNITDTATGALILTEEDNPDHVYISGLYADDKCHASDTTISIMTTFSTWLAKRAIDYPIMGWLGMRPCPDVQTKTLRDTHYTDLIRVTNGTRATNQIYAGYFLKNGFTYADSNLGTTVDSGMRLVVCEIDAVMVDDILGQYIDSAAGVAAGFTSALPPPEPLTFKPIPGIIRLNMRFSPDQLDTLLAGLGQDTNAGVVGGGSYLCGLYRSGYGYLFAKDTSCAKKNSDYRNIQILRIADRIHKTVRNIAFPYLGRPYDMQHRQALETSVRRAMNDLADLGYLLGKEGIGYTLKITGASSPFEMSAGRLTIDLGVVPVGQINKIDIRVDVSNPSN